MVREAEPDAPLVTVIHDTLLAAVEAHPVGEVSEKVPVAPAAPAAADPGEIA
jgi:hypothetical protein